MQHTSVSDGTQIGATIHLTSQRQCEVVATLRQTLDCVTVEELFWKLVQKEAFRQAVENASITFQEDEFCRRNHPVVTPVTNGEVVW